MMCNSDVSQPHAEDAVIKWTAQSTKRLEQAVQEAELKTSCEFVTVIRAWSGSYGDINTFLSFVASVSALAALLYLPFDLDPIFVVPAVIGVFIAALVALNWFCPVGLFTPERRKNEQVDDAAWFEFGKSGSYRTQDHTGVLVYISEREQQVRLVMDDGVVNAVPREVRNGWKSQLGQLLQSKQWDEELAKIVVAMGEQAGAHLPRQADDKDELINAPIIGLGKRAFWSRS